MHKKIYCLEAHKNLHIAQKSDLQKTKWPEELEKKIKDWHLSVNISINTT